MVPLIPARRRLSTQLRYFGVLAWRFRVTFLLLFLVEFGGALVVMWGHSQDGDPITYAQALGTTGFLLMGQILELPTSLQMMVIEGSITILGLAVLADGVVRFGYLFFAKHRKDKEWIAVVAHSMKHHVILCGAGKVGFRVLEQLRRMGLEVVVVERNEEAVGVPLIRNLDLPLLIGDVRDAHTLIATNVKAARAIICMTDDDLVNLNIALDARRHNPTIRVVMRLFDDDLVRKMRDALHVESLSTSALAAPAFAASALDPAIRTSFEIDGELMVVWEQVVGHQLAGRSVAQVRDELHASVLRLSRGGADLENLRSAELLREGDRAILQATFSKYQFLRQLSGREISWQY